MHRGFALFVGVVIEITLDIDNGCTFITGTGC